MTMGGASTPAWWPASNLASTGFPKSLAAPVKSQGTGPIWINAVNCFGNESSISSCGHSGWGNHENCTHRQDASVTCSHDSLPIRLVDGGASYGRVEVFDSGAWGTICDDTWDINDANVACKQLGFTGASSASTSAAHGQGSGPI